jgi:protoporphyrinogen oxidase
VTPDTIIIGAGPAGLGAAMALGEEAVVLEGAHEVAGLCRTIERDGAVFDLGGHSFHTPHPDVRELVFGALEMEEQRREAWCWLDGEWIPYPFQKHAGLLSDAAARAACLSGMAAAGDGRGAANFDIYLERRFGTPVADLFMRPYNRKLWGDDLARLSADWTGERIAGPAGAVERFVEAGGRRTPLQSDTMIAYPAQGGFGEIFRALARRVADLRLKTKIVHIDAERRRLTTSDGETLRWRRLVSTIPLPLLLRAMPDAPVAIKEAVGTLEALPVHLVMLVLEGRGQMDRQRVYSPDPTIPGHKIVLNHTSSRWLRDRPRHGIQVEVAGGRPRDPARLAEEVVAGLARIGVIGGPGDVRSAEVLTLDFGYPAPTHARDAIMRDVRAWMAARGIALAGRFAEWAYVNSDEALSRGLRLGQSLRGDRQAEVEVEFA